MTKKELKSGKEYYLVTKEGYVYEECGNEDFQLAELFTNKRKALQVHTDINRMYDPSSRDEIYSKFYKIKITEQL